MMKLFSPKGKYVVISSWFIVFFFLLFLPTTNYQLPTVFAQSTQELSQQLQQKQDEINKVQAQLLEAQKQETTLKSQLEIIDTQAKVTQLKIEETALKIAKLEREIGDLSGRIDRISNNVDKLTQVLLERIIKTYKYSSISTLDLILSSQNFGEMIERVKYIQVAQENDKKVLVQLQQTKDYYHEQKQDKEQRQAEAEQLNKDLARYNDELAQQKQAKEELLRVTKNDESKFQNLIAQLKADAASISRAISNVGIKIGPVTKGQVIGAEGLTGCTSGPHLHFEMYENAKVEGGKVLGNRVNPHNYLDDNKIGPPMQGYPGSTHISTEYGEVYTLGVHTGLDIYDDTSVGTPLLAVFDGTAYAIGDSGCSVAGFNHGPAKGVVIDDGQGHVALYWHLL